MKPKNLSPRVVRAADKRRLVALGLSFRQKRAALNRSTYELAEATGTSQSWIVEFEAGRRFPNIFRTMRIAAVLGISTKELLLELEAIRINKYYDLPDPAQAPPAPASDASATDPASK